MSSCWKMLAALYLAACCIMIQCDDCSLDNIVLSGSTFKTIKTDTFEQCKEACKAIKCCAAVGFAKSGEWKDDCYLKTDKHKAPSTWNIFISAKGSCFNPGCTVDQWNTLGIPNSVAPANTVPCGTEVQVQCEETYSSISKLMCDDAEDGGFIYSGDKPECQQELPELDISGFTFSDDNGDPIANAGNMYDQDTSSGAAPGQTLNIKFDKPYYVQSVVLKGTKFSQFYDSKMLIIADDTEETKKYIDDHDDSKQSHTVLEQIGVAIKIAFEDLGTINEVVITGEPISVVDISGFTFKKQDNAIFDAGNTYDKKISTAVDPGDTFTIEFGEEVYVKYIVWKGVTGNQFEDDIVEIYTATKGKITKDVEAHGKIKFVKIDVEEVASKIALVGAADLGSISEVIIVGDDELPCAAGNHWKTDEGVCVPCAENTFSPAGGVVSSCAPCPSGKMVAAGTGMSADDCKGPEKEEGEGEDGGEEEDGGEKEKKGGDAGAKPVDCYNYDQYNSGYRVHATLFSLLVALSFAL